MDNWNTFKLALPLLAIIGISACQPGFVLKPEPTPEPVLAEPKQEAEPQPQPPPDNMPASRRVKKSLQLLAQGEYENARNQLTWALQEKPGLQMAENLIEQIDADPIDYLGVKNFYYQVKSGDSLSVIAGKFLEDPMKFVILARYNHLDNPSKLAPGDRIRVPGAMPEQEWKKTEKKPRPVKPPSATKASTTKRPMPEGDDQAEAPTKPSDTDSFPEAPGSQLSLDQVLDIARQLHAKGDLPAAIYQLESEGSHFANAKAIQSLLVAYDKEYADLLMQQGNLEMAREVLEKLVLLNASDEQAIEDLIRVEDKLEARKLYQQGNTLRAGGSLKEAYQSFTQALTYDPDNALARQAQLECRDKLTDEYHREAMRYFRQQELDKAIALWDEILALDPTHRLAPGYKARAVEMKQKLEQIESAQ